MDKQENVSAVFLDPEKAFDCVNKSILLENPQNYGIRGVTYDLLNSYFPIRNNKLACGHQKVKIILV